MGTDYNHHPSIDQLKDLLSQQVPLIDVRAPIEYQAGSFKNAINLPLMNDSEREQVGICYKEKGHHAAVALGHELVSGQVKNQRIQEWVSFVDAHPEAVVMCFRGGMRSRISQTWLSDALGRSIPRVAGGYKALRQLAIQTLEEPFVEIPGYIIGGHTGAGKTPLLKRLKQEEPQAGVIDLEDLAKHRGSAFGNMIIPQPSQATFENHFAQERLYLESQKVGAFFFENESRAIGRIMIPQTTMNNLQALPLLVLTSPLLDRVERTWQEYILDARAAYTLAYGEEHGLHQWEEDLKLRLGRIKKRLGLERYLDVQAAFESALQAMDLQAHKSWIQTLLTDYYDPMYAYNRQRWSEKIIFEGDESAILGFIKHLLY